MPFPAKRFDRWFRLLHLYGGLFVSPFLILFAVSAILLNHGWRPTAVEPSRRDVSIQAPADLKGLDLGKEILRQTGVEGEIDYVDLKGNRLRLPVTRPGRKFTVTADLAKQSATIEERPTFFGERLIYLHKSPGPHNAAVRGNWVATRIWGVLADGTVYLLLLVTTSGIYLWYLVRPERRRGMVFLAVGCLSLVLLVLSLTR